LGALIDATGDPRNAVRQPPTRRENGIELVIQWQVVKTTVSGKVLSRVTTLDRNQRVEEIARMLAGQTITDEARKAAERLMSRSA